MGRTTEQDRPAVSGQLDALLDVLWRAGGTDLLITAGTPPQIRVQGELTPIPGYPPLTPADTDAFLAGLITYEQGSNWDLSREYDFSFSWRDLARVRGNAFSQRGQTALALRVIPQRIPVPEELGLPPILSDLARLHQGLILVTGPTGSGKSTTLASIINQVNAERPCHILTIEDPIEYVYAHLRATVSQREVGHDTQSFGDALRSALRADPDVLLVGEMRDLESIRFALSIAETGHLVFASLHTNDTAQALARIIDVFPGDQQAQVRTQLSAALTAIVYQRLLPRVGGGLIGAFEVLVANSAVRNLIKEGKTHQLRNTLMTGQRDGMVTFEQSLSGLVQAGLVTYEDAVARSIYPKDIDLHPRQRVGVG
jgi:twitching motility protein PilT